MNTTATIIIAIIAAVFGSSGFWSWLQTRNRQKSAEARLLMGIAYSKIIDRCTEYIERGYVETDEYHELEHYLFMPYREMGGNGTAEKLFNDVSKLSVKGTDHDY